MMKSAASQRSIGIVIGTGALLTLLYGGSRYRHAWVAAQDGSPPGQPMASPPNPEDTSAYYAWTYRSEGRFQSGPTASTKAPDKSSSILSVSCAAEGHWTIAKDRSTLTIDSFRCNNQDLASALSYNLHPRDYLSLNPQIISAASPVNALALALVRAINLGVDTLPESRAQWTFPEQRFGGSIEQYVQLDRQDSTVSWTKSVHGEGSQATGLQSTLQSQTKGLSQRYSEPFQGLIELHTDELETMQRGGQNLSDVSVAIRIKRTMLPKQAYPASLTETLPIPAKKADPEILRREALKDWREFLLRPKTAKIDKVHSDTLYITLKMAFRDDPHFALEFRHILDTLSPQSEEFKLLLGALAYAGSEEATRVLSQTALAMIKDKDWQYALTPVMGLLKKPTELSWQYLETLSREAEDSDVRKAAELAMASEYHAGLHTAGTQHFFDSVLAREAHTPDAILSQLDIIGNAALESEMPRIESWSQDSDPVLRAACAESLRLMNSSESEDLLLRLLSDTALDVRRTAAQSLQSRAISTQAVPKLLSALALAENRDDALQASLLETLYQTRAEPGLLAKLEAARTRAVTSPAIRERWTSLEADLHSEAHKP